MYQQAAVDREIENMLQQNIIERSCSEFCNPIRIVKKSGEVRICLDARFLNKVIASDNESPPRIEELLQKHEGAIYFSTTDLVKGYWQIPLNPESKKYTAILYKGQLYQFKRVPFGIKTAGLGFIRALSRALHIISHFVTAYVVDVLIASKNFTGHLDHLRELFIHLRVAGFTLSLKKLRFFQKSVRFVGFILDARGISADPEHLKKIEEFPCPNNRPQLQGFLGVCGYHRRFSIRHANYVDPFRDLLQVGNPWRWTNRHSQAFLELQFNYRNAVTLSHYLVNVRFRLQTDASDVRVSGILYQIDSEGDLRIISLASRVLSKYETRYTTTEKELLAIIYSVLKFRYYLIGNEFDIVTGHKALTFLLSSPFHNVRLMRWILALQEYKFEIRHCKGIDNIVVDFSSRHFPDQACTTHPNQLIWNCVRALPENEDPQKNRC